MAGPSYTFCHSPQLSWVFELSLGREGRCGHWGGGSQTEDAETVASTSTELTWALTTVTTHMVCTLATDITEGNT